MAVSSYGLCQWHTEPHMAEDIKVTTLHYNGSNLNLSLEWEIPNSISPDPLALGQRTAVSAGRTARCGA